MSDEQSPPPAEDQAPRGSMRTLLRYARPHRGVLSVVLLLTLLASAASLVQPLVAQEVLGRLGTKEGVGGPIALLGVLLVGGAALSGINAWLQQRTSERVVRQVRRGLVFRLIRLRVPELDQRPPGDLIARVTSDSTLLKSAATEGLIMCVNGVLTFLGSIVLMGSLHLGLLGVTLVVMLGVGAILTMVLPRIRLAVARAQESVGTIGATLDRTLGATRTVKANGAEDRETADSEEAVQEAYRAGLVGARYGAIVTMVSGASIQIAFMVVLGVGGVLVAANEMDVSALIAFLLYVFYLTSPIASLVTGASTLQQGLGAVGRIEQVNAMEMEEDVAVFTPGPLPYSAPPDIQLDRVKFAYPGRAPALKGISFTARGGTQTALVGLSGAGKTTMFSLLQRFYEPSSGCIRIGGQNIADLPRGEVRRRIAYVEQDAPAMAGTLRQNLLYSAPDARERDIREALRVTHLDRLVAGLPAGLDTPVGTRGVSLSGGERQRLAIARAFLRKPQVLLLDEATAQLDARNEQALSEAVARAAEHCTVILIAHRLSTVTEADQIILLEHGHVRAAGTHRELVDSDDLYRELAATQLLAGDDPSVPPDPLSIADTTEFTAVTGHLDLDAIRAEMH